MCFTACSPFRQLAKFRAETDLALAVGTRYHTPYGLPTFGLSSIVVEFELRDGVMTLCLPLRPLNIQLVIVTSHTSVTSVTTLVSFMIDNWLP